MYEDTSEEIDEVFIGNLDAAVDQLIFARSKEQDKMKKRESARHHDQVKTKSFLKPKLWLNFLN